jgi:hypothetical protein
MTDDARTDAGGDDAPPAPAPYDHVRGDGDALAEGTYRVVGVDSEAVTLLRVADSAGRRVNSGELAAVSRAAYASLEPAGNPDEAGLLTTWGLVAFGVVLFAAAAVEPLTAATGLSETALSAAGAAVVVVGLVRALRTRR